MRKLLFTLALVMIALPAQAQDLEAGWEANGWELKSTLPTSVLQSYLPQPVRHVEVFRIHSGMGNRTTDVERWRDLVETYFLPGDIATALAIMACESGGNPYAENSTSTASGLYQHLWGWWSGSWGLPAFDPFDPEQSIQAAAALRYANGGWSDWYASAHCWN